MKTLLLSRIATTALISVFLPQASFAQSPTAAGPGTPSAGTDVIPGAPPNATIFPAPVLAPAVTLNDPIVLFRLLDTDNDGKLNEDEFARISTILGNRAAPTRSLGTVPSAGGVIGTGITGAPPPETAVPAATGSGTTGGTKPSKP